MPEKPRPENEYTNLTDVPQFSDRPPVVPARVAAMKARYKQAWLYFLLLVSLTVAWGIPIRYAITRYLMFRQVNTGPRVAEYFVALAYEGISSNPREVSPERFREQLSALRKAGYMPITLKEIHEFYSEGKLLPRKAILMTFDHARKSSYYDARAPLARAGWPAVMFLWTKPIVDEDAASLRWPYARSMVRSGAWEAGAQTHRGFQRIQADSEGNLRNFMAAPEWIASEMRYETPDAFHDRIRSDHEFTRDLIVKETGFRPRAFAFPYGDFGQFDERAILSRRINMDLVSAYYDLGFIHGASALNTRYSDPRRLNRLLVRPEWTGEELVARLESAWPRDLGVSDADALGSPLVWLTEWGGFVMSNRVITIKALPEITGAKAWMNGTDLYDDFTARYILKIDRGQVGLFFRATPDGERHLYLGLGDRGDVWLRQKHAGLQPFTLGSARYTPGHQGVIELDVHIRGRHFFASIGGRPVFQEIITTRGVPDPGMLGISIWDPEPGAASAHFSGLHVTPFRTSLLTWAPTSSRDPSLSAWMNRFAVRHTHLASPWLRVASRTQAEQFGWDAELFSYFSRIYSMKWTPEVIFENLEAIEAGLPDQLADSAAGLGADGVYCNLSELRGSPPLSRVTSWIQSFSRALEQRGLQLIIRLPSSLERESTLSALLQSLPMLEIAVDLPPETFFAHSPAEARRIVSVSSVSLHGITTPFFAELTGGDAVIDEWESEVRSKLLRQEGHDAFVAGKFDLALSIWRHWSELEPFNEEPYRLMGDVHLRRGDRPAAIEAYRASLDRNPGQLPLVIQTARLLDQNPTERQAAEDMLNLYARLFPGNPDIMLGQAELLIRRKQPQEARRLVQQVITENPDDLAALAMLHGLLPTTGERLQNINAILNVGSRPGMEPHFAEAIRSHDLLIWPESWVLMPFIEQMADQERAHGLPPAYGTLVPRQTQVEEAFALGRMSDNWIANSEVEGVESGTFLLAAGPATSEATLRLANSDAMHSGFLESLIEESRGYFWIYARRGEGSMIRFGFEQAERMYLQIWHQGRLLANQVRPWTRPDGPVRLRLELRGDAAFGFVDGKPAFGAPTRIPVDMGLGWWGFSPWSPHFGVAQVALREVAGGPLPVRLGVVWPRSEDWTDDEIIAALGAHAPELQAIAPPWFVQDGAGRVRPEMRGDYPNVRMMSRFYQIRMLPAVRSASPRNLDVRELIPLAKEANVDGFTLVFTRMPEETWFKQAEAVLAESGISLVAIRLNRQDRLVELREVCPHVGLFAGARRVHLVPLVEMNGDAANEDEPVVGPPVPESVEKPMQPHQILIF